MVNNPFVQLMIAVWVCSAVAAVFTKNAGCIDMAGQVTLLSGLGYFFYKIIQL